MDDNLLSEKQIAVLKYAFSPDEYYILENICRYYGLTETDIAEVEGWIEHGTDTKLFYLVLIYEYVERFRLAMKYMLLALSPKRI